MVYKFRILSDEDKEFARELLIAGDNTFLDFHHCIQENLEYDPMQLASFFVTNAAWEKQKQITLLDMQDEEDANVLTMDTATISDFISDPNQRLLYVFDFFSERSFFIELTDTIDIPDKKTDPKIVYSTGNPPVQIKLELNIPDTGVNDFQDDSVDDDQYGDDMLGDMDFLDSDDLSDD